MNSYKEIPWLTYRNDIIDFLNLGKDRNPVYGLLEVDITKVSHIFSEREKQGNKSNSIITYLLWCFGQAVKSHPEIQAIKKGDKLILFDDVDIAMMVEKSLREEKKIPVPHIFRSVQNKSYHEINDELQNVKNRGFNEVRKRKKSPIFSALPNFMRLFILRRLLKSPVKSKEAFGTVALTSLGMVMDNRRFWPIPIGPYPCTIASGGTYTKRETDGEKIMLCLTFCIDHNLTDGAPGTRFSKTLINLLESGEGLS